MVAAQPRNRPGAGRLDAHDCCDEVQQLAGRAAQGLQVEEALELRGTPTGPRSPRLSKYVPGDSLHGHAKATRWRAAPRQLRPQPGAVKRKWAEVMLGM
ncbi:unnamed protein product [Linum trigynum]|uniref:Uncharacterized protein n=1 Tax=Linum trigynum TaxID=586398 RepID=A0AAV2F068_9ROSI